MAENATEDFPFTFESDKGATTVDMKREVPVIAMELLGGVEGSLLDITKGEFLWDNYRVVYQDDVGEDKGYELRYGVNVTDLKQEENIADTITGIVPYFYSEGYDEPSILVTLDEYTLYSEHAANFPFKRTTVMDFSSYFEVGYDEDHHIIPPTKEQLKEVCEQYMTDAGIGVPKVSIDVSFENLARSKEYSFLKTLSLVKIYDTVTVIFPLLGITKKAKVIKTVYDVQQEKYITITIGDKQESLSSRLADTPTTSEIKEQTEDALSQFNSSLRERIDAAVEDTSKSILFGKGGYVVFGQDETTSPPHMDRILIMDTPDESTATNIIQMNQNGIGFSTDGGQTYNQAWGINGHFNTDYISGETIDAITINTANLNGGYLNSMYVNVAEGIRFNYGTVKDSNYVDAGVGSIQTHITANDPITWTGLTFKCNNSGSSATWTDTNSDGILFDSRNFAVQAKGITLCASHGNRSAGLTVANMNSDSARIILQNRNWGSSGYSRVELTYGQVSLRWGSGKNQIFSVSESGLRFRDTYYKAKSIKTGDNTYVTVLAET